MWTNKFEHELAQHAPKLQLQPQLQLQIQLSPPLPQRHWTELFLPAFRTAALVSSRQQDIGVPRRNISNMYCGPNEPMDRNSWITLDSPMGNIVLYSHLYSTHRPRAIKVMVQAQDLNMWITWNNWRCWDRYACTGSIDRMHVLRIRITKAGGKTDNRCIRYNMRKCKCKYKCECECEWKGNWMCTWKWKRMCFCVRMCVYACIYVSICTYMWYYRCVYIGSRLDILRVCECMLIVG